MTPMASYVVTGGAGFIGSNLVEALEARGDDVIVVDEFGHDAKWRNLAKRRLYDVVAPGQLFPRLDSLTQKPKAIFHCGAISATTETDVDLIVETNFRLSCRIWRWCAEQDVPLIYASSAATYGEGSQGWRDDDDSAHLAALRPLNAYGWSKHLFDRWAVHRVETGLSAPPRWAGLKFFNVYGPNEAHKGPQRSVASQIFDQIAAGQNARLFRSEHPDYPDGGQLRDFVWVGDCVDAALWFADGSPPNGLYNIGSGKARSFIDLARAAYAALGREPQFEFIAMPAALAAKYQYFTEADMTKLQAAGWNRQPLALEDGVRRYYQEFLTQPDPYR
jgi:ADP-L-glycero-D-manno-heptose 6-epimerase